MMPGGGGRTGAAGRPGGAGLAVALLGMSLAGGAPLQAQMAGGTCLECHRTLDEAVLSEAALAWSADVHFEAGLTCAGCHGGEATSSDEGTAHAGMRARPARQQIPGMCGRCHSNQEFMRSYDPDIRIDQVEAYYTSRHGELLLRGDTHVATCVDCHASHAILSSDSPDSPTHPPNLPDRCGSCHANEEAMGPYDVDTDQLEAYKSSVHWTTLVDEGDLSSPVCNDCHGNHGAVPPGYTAVGRVCGECHFQIGQYFAASPHDSVFVGLERPGCATCHGNHAIQEADDELLGLGDRSTCVDAGCHSESDEGGRVADRMRGLVDSLHRAHARADSILEEAEVAGMPVQEPMFQLTQVRNAIVGARAVMHTANLDSMSAKIDEGLQAAGGGYQAGLDAFAELRVRRTGLAVSSVVILLVIIGLVIKIRQLEAR